MKKRYLFASMMVMAAVTLAGCGGNASSSQEASSTTEATSSVSSTDTSSVPSASEVQPDTDAATSSAANETVSATDETTSTVSDTDDLDPQAFIGVSMDEFKTTFGEPTSSGYDTGSDGSKVGTYKYDKFTVTTHTNDDGSEVVDSVE